MIRKTVIIYSAVTAIQAHRLSSLPSGSMYIMALLFVLLDYSSVAHISY